MATGRSIDNAPSPALAWAVILAGAILAAAWIWQAINLAAKISFESIELGLVGYNALIFGPLILIALGCGWLSKVSPLAVGNAPLSWALAGFGFGAGGLLATLGLSALNGGLVAGSGSQAGAGLLLLGLAMTLFQTLSEELLFRGWLQPALIRQTGPLAGVLIAAILFGSYHILGGARGAIAIVNLILGGLLFGLLALRSGSVVAPLGAHFAWNAIEDLGFGLVPNPGVGSLGALWDKDLMGSPLWGGVEDGLNASLGTTFVLIALILPLLGRSKSANPRPATT